MVEASRPPHLGESAAAGHLALVRSSPKVKCSTQLNLYSFILYKPIIAKPSILSTQYILRSRPSPRFGFILVD